MLRLGFRFRVCGLALRLGLGLQFMVYLSELLHVYTPSRTLRSSSDTRMLEINNTNARLMAFAPSLALDLTFGIHSHKTLDTVQPCHLLKPN